MSDSCYYKSRTQVYPHYPPHHISGITPKKFLRRPLHPSQELHRCSGIWTPVCLNKSGQLPLTLRSAVIPVRKLSHYKHPIHIWLHKQKINLQLFCPPSYPSRGCWKVTHMIDLELRILNPNTASGLPKTEWAKKKLMEETKDRGNIETSRAKVSRGDAEGPFNFLRGLKPSVFWSPYKYSLVYLYFILFFFPLESRNAKVLHGCFMHDSQSLLLLACCSGLVDSAMSWKVSNCPN